MITLHPTVHFICSVTVILKNHSPVETVTAAWILILVLSIDREGPLREAFVAAEEPVAPERLPSAIAPGGFPQGHRLLPVPAGEGHPRGQAGM